MWAKARAVGNARALSTVRAGAPQAHRPYVHGLPPPRLEPAFGMTGALSGEGGKLARFVD
jgi:hypothetical protein